MGKQQQEKKQLKYGGVKGDVVTSFGKPFIVIGAFFDFDDCQHFSRVRALLKVVQILLCSDGEEGQENLQNVSQPDESTE